MDISSALSILPHQAVEPATGQGLVRPNGSAIPCWVECPVKLQLAGHLFTWKFLLADVSRVILGIDFLRTHSLTVGPGTCRRVQASGHVFPAMAVTSGPTASVITGTELLPISSLPSSEPPSAAADVKVPSRLSAAALSAGKAASASPPTPAAHQQAGHSSAVPAKRQERAAISSVNLALVSKLPLFFKLLLQRYEDVVIPSKVLPQTSHGVEHHLETRGLPIASPFSRLDGQKLAAMKAEFAALELDWIIRWSCSPWVSPLHMVKKPDGSWRCGDYRRLNNVTVPDTYPLPNMIDFSSRVAGCSIFSKIDFPKGIIKFLCTLLTS